jgi:hypothetical protein
MYSGGVPTRHTQMGRPTYEAPTREYYTHKHTQTQTNTQRGPTKYGADSRRGGALLRTLYRPDQGGHADVGVCPKYYRKMRSAEIPLRRESLAVDRGRLRCQHAAAAMTSQERFSVHSQLEHLQAKYVGTGHADTTKLCAPPRLPIACCLLRAPCPCADGFCR